MNTITIELCSEDRERLDKIIGLLSMKTVTVGLCAEDKDRINKVNDLVEKPTEEEPQKESPAEKAEATKQEELPKENTPEAQSTEQPKSSATVEDLRKMVITLSSAGRKEEAREIIKAYASKVSEVPADKVDECMTKLKALG